jgi:hypothetical protein
VDFLVDEPQGRQEGKLNGLYALKIWWRLGKSKEENKKREGATEASHAWEIDGNPSDLASLNVILDNLFPQRAS